MSISEAELSTQTEPVALVADLRRAILNAGEEIGLPLETTELDAISALVQQIPLIPLEQQVPHVSPEVDAIRYDISLAKHRERYNERAVSPRHLALYGIFRTVQQTYGGYFEPEDRL